MSKVFIITGASKGIGAAIVKYLLGQQHKLVLTARSENLLQSVKTAHPDRVEYLAGDMTDSEIPAKLVSLAVSTYGRLDGMVLNHGVLENIKFADMSVDDFKRVYDVNVFSCFAMAKAALEELRKSNGSVIWVSSGAATKPVQAWTAYGSSKTALNSLSSHLGLEEPDITSIAIAPGRVDTDMQATLRSQGKDTMAKAAYDSFVQGYETGTLLKPHQPGNVIARLLAKPPKNLSGQFFTWNASELADYQE